ncbi:Uncharacterised protein [Burkholderia pseudomallei]|uniref:hypothetical protein n=1 Tax=Burkholderia pseudomallei TaxID=28450 RepID=UPI0005E88C86|nr:hypothetical protein [Burkholderia pseudomallei]QGS77290.1 hypothetical protein PMC2000_00790 [Burkholderia pseudomallei]CAJ2906368.1 Uncharacterised protein [Burkholderia pseudomallei]CAJ3273679.1 Uncharacterised protein [Burkholderia pseudomallei]CAJ3675714.1 Uncharacterised protein [Burkholderia pseudomallei]CAJ3740338.1 Uncharacterised protein [Burkholderia pseudomallei]
MSIQQSHRFGPLATEVVDKFLSVGPTRVAHYPGMTCVAELPHALKALRKLFNVAWDTSRTEQA